MKNIFQYLKTFLPKNEDVKNFYELSSKDRIKIMRSAAREAQKEQQLLLRRYDSQFKRT